MRSEHYIHPEFGLLAPTPRAKRELLIGFFSLLFGISIGIVAVSVILSGERSGDGTLASPAAAQGSVPPTPTAPSAKVSEQIAFGSSGAECHASVTAKGACDGDRFVCQESCPLRAAEGGPPRDRSAIASAPINRPQVSTDGYPAGRPVERMEPIRNSPTSAPLRDVEQSAPTTLLSARKARRTSQQTGQDLRSQTPNANLTGAAGDARVGPNQVRDRSSRRFGFWDWSP
jgi:hypothetical protein